MLAELRKSNDLLWNGLIPEADCHFRIDALISEAFTVGFDIPELRVRCPASSSTAISFFWVFQDLHNLSPSHFLNPLHSNLTPCDETGLVVIWCLAQFRKQYQTKACGDAGICLSRSNPSQVHSSVIAA